MSIGTWFCELFLLALMIAVIPSLGAVIRGDIARWSIPPKKWLYGTAAWGRYLCATPVGYLSIVVALLCVPAGAYISQKLEVILAFIFLALFLAAVSITATGHPKLLIPRALRRR